MEQNRAQFQELPITQMRRLLNSMGSSAEKFGDPTLRRFLVARSMDPERAAKMFVQWQEWRASFVPLGSIPVEEIRDELGARKVFLQGGLTRDGHALLIVQARRHLVPKDQLQFKKFVVHLLDKAVASAIRGNEERDEKLVALLDLQNFSYKNVDPRSLINGFQFLQAYYPERLAKLYLYSMPWIFVSVWKLVCPFLDKATLEKVVIVRSEEERMALVEEIGKDVLPQEYGGEANLSALQDVKLNHWPPRE